MKNKWLSLLIALCLLPAVARAQAFVNLTPQPKQMSVKEGALPLTEKFTVCTNKLPDSLAVEAERFVAAVNDATGLNARVKSRARKALVSMERYEAGDLGAEGYLLDVTPRGVTVKARTSAGFFYAFQTLKKLLPAGVALGKPTPGATTYALPLVSIVDEPRFAHRGFMLDVARHFFTVEQVKKMIDLMAVYKMNRFHWHLSDDQGWRVEIKKWPRLTEVGSIAPNSYQWDWERGSYYTNAPYGPYFYTQEQLRDVVAYAKERHIEIIPEIDMPGHFVAAMNAYPEFSCTPDAEHKGWLAWGVSTDVLNVANPAAVAFAQDILSEIMDVFPYEYVHIGGDECPTKAWEANALCQEKMKRLGLKHARELQSHFIKDMADFVARRGRKLIVWNEAITAPHADVELIRQTGATVMCWIGERAAAKKATELGLDNILTPYYFYYINRKQQQDADWMTVAGDGKDDLKRTYNYVPITDDIDPANHKYFRGVQGTFWTEHVADDALLEYLALPRLMAIAEAGWSPQSAKDFDSFVRRMQADTTLLDLGGYRYSPHYLKPVPPRPGKATEKQ